MAAIADLTFEQLSDKLPEGALIATAPAAGVPGKVMLDVSALTGDPIDVLADVGVVKMISILLDKGFLAQATVNQGQIAGERLNAFGAAANGAAANGYVPATRSLTTRIELASATRIIGAAN